MRCTSSFVVVLCLLAWIHRDLRCWETVPPQPGNSTAACDVFDSGALDRFPMPTCIDAANAVQPVQH
jgi:hypothetical protein